MPHDVWGKKITENGWRLARTQAFQGFPEQVTVEMRGWGGGQIQLRFHCLLMETSSFVSIPWESGWYRKLWIK